MTQIKFKIEKETEKAVLTTVVFLNTKSESYNTYNTWMPKSVIEVNPINEMGQVKDWFAGKLATEIMSKFNFGINNVTNANHVFSY